MGRNKKASAPELPKYQSSEIKYGDKTVGKVYQDPVSGNLVNQYFPDEQETARKNQLQGTLNSLISNLGTIDQAKINQYNQISNDYLEKAKKDFLDNYNPTVDTLKSDIVSRFGTLNSSKFVDDLGKLEKIKADSLSEITSNASMLSKNLMDQDRSKDIETIKTFASLNGLDTNNFLNNLVPLNNSNSLNTFNNNQYLMKLKEYQSNLNTPSSLENIFNIGSSFMGLGTSKSSSSSGNMDKFAKAAQTAATLAKFFI